MEEAKKVKQGYGPLTVMRSAAGYYIGRYYYDDTVEEGYKEPGSRESGYYATKEEAEKELKEFSFEVRDCMENNFAYDSGTVEDIRPTSVEKEIEEMIN